MQLIYAGKMERCHPQGVKFPEGFNITATPNHWSNEEKAIKHLEVIVFSLPDGEKKVFRTR